MDVTRLRTLTWKSKIGFGRHSLLTVRELFNLNHARYLRWIYFNVSSITYMPDVLKEIRIPEKYFIEKPGTFPEGNDNLNRYLGAAQFRNFGIINYAVQRGISQKEQKRGLARHYARDAMKFSRGIMQRKNQGHK